MHPVLIKIGPISIYSYGVMVALGFGLATLLVIKNAGRGGLDKNRIIDFAILALTAGIVGARLFYVLLNIEYYRANPFEIFDLSKGGLVWYGGFSSASLVSIWYLKKNGIQFWIFADLVAPYIALGQSLGRIGCFLNGCCFGIESSSHFPLAVIFPGGQALRHPAQIYSSLALLFIFFILRIWHERPHFNGQIFLGYCILYSMKRFILEFLRGDNPGTAFFNLTISQAISILVFSIATSVFVCKAFKWKRALLQSK